MNIRDYEYEPIEVTAPSIPERKMTLLTPIGSGTFLREGPNSVLARTAQKYGLEFGTFLYEIFLDGVGYCSVEEAEPTFYVEAYELMNVQRQLEGLCDKSLRIIPKEMFFLPSQSGAAWPKYFRKVRRMHRAWCPGCYHEWRCSGHTVYDPLIWNLSLITVCPIHRVHILTKCPHCGKRPPLFAANYQPGYCSVCKKWLGKESTGDNYVFHDFRWHKWIFKNLGEILVSQHAHLHVASYIDYFLLIQGCFDELGQPSIDLRATLEGCVRTLESFFRLFYASGIPFGKVFRRDEYLQSYQDQWRSQQIAIDELKKRRWSQQIAIDEFKKRIKSCFFVLPEDDSETEDAEGDDAPVDFFELKRACSLPRLLSALDRVEAMYKKKDDFETEDAEGEDAPVDFFELQRACSLPRLLSALDRVEAM